MGSKGLLSCPIKSRKISPKIAKAIVMDFS
jgi:hypothetical protein